MDKINQKISYIVLAVVILAALVLLVGNFSKDDQQRNSFGVVTDQKETTYHHPNYPFYFVKPDGYTVGVVPFGEKSEAVIVQNKEYGPETGFQIYITPDFELEEINPGVLAAELPEMSVKDPKKIRLDEKADGIMFFSDHPDFGGDSFELWFVFKGVLYQVSSYASFSEELKNIIETWRFD